MPKSSNAIYLLFEQWECLRVTKLFSWARRRNSSQPGSKLNKLQETPWSLLSRNTLTLIADLTLDRCQSKFASDWLSLSRLLLSAFTIWLVTVSISLLIVPALNKHCNYLITWAAGLSTGGHCPGYAGVTWESWGKGEVRAQTLTTCDPVSSKYPSRINRDNFVCFKNLPPNAKFH